MALQAALPGGMPPTALQGNPVYQFGMGLNWTGYNFGYDRATTQVTAMQLALGGVQWRHL